MKVINLFAGPGASKSTTAAGTFFLMKRAGLNVELVTEYAKHLTWDKRHNVLEDQLYVLAKQHRHIARLRGQVDYVITDGPFLQGLVYIPEGQNKILVDLIIELHQSFDNHNVFLKRVKKYLKVGRTQSLKQAKVLDGKISAMLANLGEQFQVVNGDWNAPEAICKQLGIALNTTFQPV
jgi:hypothetical protein